MDVKQIGGVSVERLEGRLLMHGGHHGLDAFVTQTNLVSDGFVAAQNVDKNLINPWGVAFGPTSPFWISDNNSGLATLYDGAGTPQSLVVNIPGGGGAAGNPTGQVFNGGPGFVVHEGAKSGPAAFILVGEDGGISGWSPAVDTHNAILAVDNSSVPDAANGAVYKGATLAPVSKGHSDLFVANFRAGTIEAYDDTFAPVHFSNGAFQDRHIPAGYAPFNVQNVNGKLYVTYAKQNDQKHDDVAGAGNGFVDVYNTRGKLLQRLQHGSFLNSPWGVTQAPASWGHLAGDILVGQFGSGNIDIFNRDGRFVGFLNDSTGAPVTIDGLWDITPGNATATNGGKAGSVSSIYFTAGLNHEQDGLFGSLTINNGDNDNDLGSPSDDAHDHGMHD
ncbi:MAG TPA: TIGR03118 family protein [Tepidisphaeraceae bacterium]|nr:TIGR03118 family protein [Tepidisphaeraceae bacterium]